MKRVGARGEGRFERISWDEALNTVANELKRVRETYGSAAILYLGAAGDLGMLHDSSRRMGRLLCLMGGYTPTWGTSSFEGGIFAELATYGSAATALSSRDDLLNSRLIVLWGWDPVNTIADTNTSWYLAQAKEAGIKIISIDPRYTDSTATFAQQWIPIRPGTDAAMLIAMANAIVTGNLQDQAFLDAHTTGFEAFKDYILGVEDGIPKTPGWAEAITGVPAATIQELAEEYATTKPAALLAGIAPGRTAYGEQYHRVAITLSAMTGNVGVPGGSAAGRVFSHLPLYRIGPGMRSPGNPVEAGAPAPSDRLSNRSRYVAGRGVINIHKLTDAILKGKSGGYPADYKLLYINESNYLNQCANINKITQAVDKLEFIAVEEQFMTSTARFADILLPVTTSMERNDLVLGATPPFYGYRNKVIEPLYEVKSQLEIADELAERLGITDYNDKTEDEWLRQIVQGSDVPDYDTFKEHAIFKIQLPQPHIAFSKEVHDPANNPFPTPSGKIEIYSQQIADMDNPELPSIPKYIETWESPNDPLAVKYPLQLITTHFKRRAHTQFDNIPWLRELEPQAIKINTIDAQARDIKDGDLVRVFNDRGSMIIAAKVTERIMSSVVDLPQGAWYSPDENGVDRAGCANVLTRDKPSPGRAFSSNTALVQVEKA